MQRAKSTSGFLDMGTCNWGCDINLANVKRILTRPYCDGVTFANLIIEMRVFYQKITSDIFSISSLAKISMMSFTAFTLSQTQESLIKASI